jgi:enoyl-CoA hydratase
MPDDAPEAPVLVERSGSTLVVTFNRPHRLNALTPESYIRLAEAWYLYRDDSTLRAAILTGAGNRAFTAGADLGITIPLLNGTRRPQDAWEERFMADLSLMNDGLLRNLVLHKPVIAAVNGVAAGAGAEMLQATDLRLIVKGARVGLPEVQRALIPGGGSVTRLIRQIPWAVAAELLLLGEPISAERAAEIGLVNEVVDPADLLPRARTLADRLARNGPLAVQAIKEGMLQGSGRPLDESLAIEHRLVARILRTKDCVEGARAFVEKRLPDFRGE